MKTIELEELVAGVILDFCENLAEVGCPKDAKESDMWYRNLTWDEQKKVADKLLSIIERDDKRFGENPKKTNKGKKGNK